VSRSQTIFPVVAAEHDRFVLERRGNRASHDPWHYQGLTVEDERTAEGRVARTGTVFLTGRECPWRCTMCDLWKHTTEADTPIGAIPAQIAAAREALRHDTPPVTILKLYNAGSFFDPRAVPVSDYRAIAERLVGLERVIVESHPALIGPRVDAFLAALEQTTAVLEIAIGLETANPSALDQLNKRFTIDDFRMAATSLRARNVAVRVFLLVSPPFIIPEEQDRWLTQSIDAAFSAGASIVSLVPTRSGNGAMEALAASDVFREPSLEDVERSLVIGLRAAATRGSVFVDLWDLSRFATCPACFDRRKARLHAMNLAQGIFAPPDPCVACGAFQ
jgi:radical SAM enzyme (TIGR01210 family)